MSGAPTSHHRQVIRKLGILLGLLALGGIQQVTLGEAHASVAQSVAMRHDLRAPYDPYVSRSLDLRLPAKLKVGKRKVLTVDGYAYTDDEVVVFLDPKGKECPSAASARPDRAIMLVSEDAEGGDFRIRQDFVPQGAGSRTFCAYLVPAADGAALQASETRAVASRRLQESTAKRTVVTALKRHGFARRVVKSLRVRCRRQSRNLFGCTFSARLPGYRMKGRGQVRLGVRLTYGFRVEAQGVRFTLTDENEDRNSAFGSVRSAGVSG